MKTLKLVNTNLVKYERRNNSAAGNPSFSVWFTNGTGLIAGKTASDASCGYAATNFSDGRACDVTYHITRAGNVIIDEIEEA